jgi:hypothetical protein
MRKSTSTISSPRNERRCAINSPWSSPHAHVISRERRISVRHDLCRLAIYPLERAYVPGRFELPDRLALAGRSADHDDPRRLAATWAASDQRKLGKSRRPKLLFDALRRKPRPVAVEDVLDAIEGSYVQTGFGYTEYRAFSQAYGESYGATFITPSWLMKLIQSRNDATIIGFKERGFANHQDVVTLQKLPI